MISSASIPRVRKVSITNTFASNGGDAAILFAILQQVRAQFGPDVQIVVFDQQQDLVARYLPTLDFRQMFLLRVPTRGPKLWLRGLRLWLAARLTLAAHLIRLGGSGLARLLLGSEDWRDLQDYATSDLVISTGGTYLVETYPLGAKIFDLQLAIQLGRPLVLYTQSLGPFRRPLHRRLLRRVFDAARLVLLRDELSASYVRELGGRTDHLVVSSDIVFSVAEPETLAQAGVLEGLKGRRFKVAFSVRDWPYFKQRDPRAGMELYLESVAAMVTCLVTKYAAEVVFLSTCQGIPEYREDDSAVAMEIKRSLDERVSAAVQVDRGFQRYENLLAAYGSCDLVISTRMHGAILALASGTPVLPIAYEFKTRELFTRFGLKDWVLDIETIQASTAVPLLERYIAEVPQLREALFNHVEASRQQAVESGRLMRQALEAEVPGLAKVVLPPTP